MQSYRSSNKLFTRLEIYLHDITILIFINKNENKRYWYDEMLFYNIVEYYIV